MCVDDYEFRHYSAVRPKQCRRFTFINQDDIQKVFLVNISQFQQDGEVALCKIIFHLSGRGLPIANRKFYWPKYNVSVEPGDYCKVPFSALSDREINFNSLLKIDNQQKLDFHQSYDQLTAMQQQTSQKKLQTDDSEPGVSQCSQCHTCMRDEIQKQKQKENKNQNQNQKIGLENQNEIIVTAVEKQKKQQSVEQSAGSSIQQSKSDQQSIKRIKQPERQIGEVILAVKKWRKLYESKRLNLTKAAKLIGISKKSLDDYYLVLRVGEILQFDYGSNLQSKMGDLRAYIRAFNHKVTGKLTKQVVCFELVPDFQIETILEEDLTNSQSSRIQLN